MPDISVAEIMESIVMPSAQLRAAAVLHAAAMQAIGAIDARDLDAISEVGGAIDEACESCHLQFWYPEQQ